MNSSIDILRKNSLHFFKQFNMLSVRHYVLENFKDDCELIIKKADLLLENIFIFNEKWDMEQCTTPYKLEDIDWLKSPNNDEEWTFMLNRHEYLYNLVIAFYLTNDYKYFDKWKFFILDWIKKNKIDFINPTKSCRTIDTGIRCLSWTMCLALLGQDEYISDDELKIILNSLDVQNNFLKEKFIDKQRLVNWGVLQTTGTLSSIILTNEDPYNNDLFNWALNKYTEQLTLQVFDDGLQWEQSPMYHVEVLLSTLKVIYFSKVFNISLPKIIYDTAYKMSNALIYTTKPNFHQVMQSDSDDTDTRDILVKSSMLFNDSTLKFRGYSIADFSSACLFGNKYVDLYNNIIPTEPSSKNKYFEDAGNTYLRTSWNTDATFSYFHNGSLGGGHGHADLLHFDISYKGKDFLIDSGRYTYVEGNKYRNELKSAYAHNTLVLDDDPFTSIKDSWCFNKAALAFKNYVKFKDNISYIEMPLKGSVDDNKDYLMIRKVINIEPCIWIVVDYVKAAGSHTLSKYYHFDPDVNSTSNDNLTLLENDNESLFISHFGTTEHTIKDTYISKHFNTLEKNNTLICKKSFDNSTTCCDIIYGKELANKIKITPIKLLQPGKDNPLSSNVSTSFKLTVGTKTYFIALIHEEVFDGNKLLVFQNNENIGIYGKAIVVEQTSDNTNYIRLKY